MSTKTAPAQKKDSTKSKTVQTKKVVAAKKAADNEAKRIQSMIADNSFVELTIAWKNVQPVYQQQLKKMSQQLKLKGFRQGKIPLNIAEEKIGHKKLVDATLQQLLPAAYEQALKDNKKQPLTGPRFQGISVNKDNDWILKAYFAEKPELKVKGYKKIVLSSKKKANKEIKKIEKKFQTDAKKTKTDKKSKLTKDKKDQPASSRQGGTQPQELTKQQKEDMIIQMVFADLVTELKPKIPELLIKQKTEDELRNLVKRLEQLNLTLDKYLEAQHSTKEQITSQLALSSLNQLQVEFLLAEIADQEKIEASQKDVDSKIKEVEDEKLRQQMVQDKNYQNYLQKMLVKQKVIRYLLDL